MTKKNNNPPAEALRTVLALPAEVKLSAGSPQNPKSKDVRLVARSGDPIDHYYYGKVVHDFSTMTHKPVIAIDFEHWRDETIGFVNGFDTSDGDLVLTGRLTSVLEGDRAEEVMLKMEAEFPYEASIEFGEDFDTESFGPGETATVNGREVEGPLLVIKRWTLRAVAICKLGYDAQSSAELLLSYAGRPFGPQALSKGMPEADKPAAEAKTETPKPADQTQKPAEPTTPDADTPAADTPAPAEDAAPATELAADDPRAEFRRFKNAFGDKAGEYFDKGLTFSDATVEFVKAVRAENEDLRTKLSASGNRGNTPVPAGSSDDQKRQFSDLFKRRG